MQMKHPHTSHMTYFTISLLLILLFPFTSIAQPLPIDIEGKSLSGKKMIFVAEAHTIPGRWSLYTSLVQQAVKDCGITAVVLECGHASAYLYDRYVSSGDTTYYRYYPADTVVRNFLDDIRAINSTLPAGKQIHIRGMDFERTEFIIVVRGILAAHPSTAGTQLSEYIHHLPDSVIQMTRITEGQHQYRKKCYKEACSLFRAERKALKSQMPAQDYHLLELILDNPATEAHFALRDRGMLSNLQRQHITDSPFLCITGSYHASWRRGNVFISLLKRVAHHYPTRDIALIDLIYNGPHHTYRLFSPDGSGYSWDTSLIARSYIKKNDSVLNRGYRQYAQQAGKYKAVHRQQFTDVLHRSEHHLDTWYIFMGTAPALHR